MPNGPTSARQVRPILALIQQVVFYCLTRIGSHTIVGQMVCFPQKLLQQQQHAHSKAGLHGKKVCPSCA